MKSFQTLSSFFFAAIWVALNLGCHAPPSPAIATSKGNSGPPSSTAKGSAEKNDMVQISGEAAILLQQMITAYQKLDVAELDGNIWARFEMEDGVREVNTKFNSAFHQPNQFKHVLQQDLLIGSSGETVFVFQKSANAFFETNQDLTAALPTPLPQMLQAQNPSLLMALAKNPLVPLGMSIEQITRLEDVVVGDRSCPALSIKPADGDYNVLVLLDPDTKLLKRLRVEMQTSQMKNSSDYGHLKSVVTEVDYSTIQLAPEFQPTFFEWVPPEGSERMASLEGDEIFRK
ncbi:MAG TPA: hypothetical protein VMZ27_12890 [Candidatus Saccharimonadales bacterium]|nr:hypothetical protein [Candidatus Saccharimonadales bacterium]